MKSKIHKTVDNDLKRKIRFFQDYVEIDNFSGQTLDSNFLANFNYNTDFNTILKNWYNPYLFLRKLIGYFLFRRWEIISLVINVQAAGPLKKRLVCSSRLYIR